MDRWKIESAGSAGRPYSLDQLRTMVSAGMLKPSDRVVKEDGSESAQVGDLLPPEPVDAPAVASPSATPQRKGIRWLLLGGAILLLAAGGGGIYYATRTPEPSVDLPEWFDPAYRIQKNRAIIYASASGDKAKYDGKAVGPPGKYNDEWLDKHFTHYIGTQNAFCWANPRFMYPSDGKIMAGIKVVAGPEFGNLILICALTEDGRPENMFVPTETLQERSKGPPKIDK